MRKQINSEIGFSVIEVLVVIVIVAVVTAFAIAQFGGSKNQFQRQNIAREFKVNLERSRFDSVRRRASEYSEMAQVVIKSPTTYDVILDTNQNGILESFETRTVDFSGSRDVKILTPTTNFPLTIRFDKRGFVASDNIGNRISPIFTICNGICSLTSPMTPENSNVIAISPTGTISMLFGGDAIVPIGQPEFSTVDPTNGINRGMTVMPDVTVTPSPTPIATTNPGATPQPTPTPTSTPRTCSLNERPNRTGCSCQSPMTIRQNGKCY